MTRKILFLLICLSLFKSYSQNDIKENISCEYKFKSSVKYLLYNENITESFFSEIKKTNQTCNDSLNKIDDKYINHLITLRNSSDKDSLKNSFVYIKNVAAKNPKNMDFLYAVGNYYRLGKGCDQDFDLAYSFYNQSANLGNKYAKYSIAYLKLKGFGTNQNYSTAYNLFQQEDLKMSKHWEAFCKYFGYGTNQSKEEGLRLFLDNNTELSKTYRKTLSKDSLNILNKNDELNLNFNKNYELSPSKISKIVLDSYLYELDWSEEYILRKIPIEYYIDLHSSEILFKINGFEFTSNFNFDKKNNVLSEIENLSIKNLYTNNKIKYKITSLEIKKALNNNKNTFITELITFIPEYNEPGPKWLIISEIKEIIYKESPLDALIVSPNPFSSKFKITINTINEDLFTIDLYDYSGLKIKTLHNSFNLLKIGRSEFEFNLNNLNSGFYILKITLGNQKIDKVLIKE